jgi:prolyl-tRNA synthetase
MTYSKSTKCSGMTEAKTSIGEKLKDADLIGCPYQLVISKKSLENGGIELIKRQNGEKVVIEINNLH